MQLCIKNSRFLTNIWSITHNHHLDDRLSLSHVSRRRRRRSRVGAIMSMCPLMNGTATHQSTVVYDAVTEATSKKNYPKNVLPPPHLEIPKDIATKSRETHLRDFGIPWGYRPQTGRKPVRDPHLP